jgi:phospholipase/carboxylesterase
MQERTMSKADFIHRFQPAASPGLPPLLLLHGTGGDENDLIPLGEAIAPGAALLSPRGKVLENGMPRFFRRLAEGVLDEDDLRARALELADFVGHARERYGLTAPVAVGFSNGANIAAAMLLLAPAVLGGAVLLRAMPPFKSPPPASIPGTRVLAVSGALDPMVAGGEANRLASMLTDAGARVRHEILPAGHAMTRSDLQLATRFLASLAEEP